MARDDRGPRANPRARPTASAAGASLSRWAWRRTVLVAFVLAQTELPPLTRHTSLVSNLVVILLFDLSFLLLGLLLLLVGRNLAKVIFEHRRGLIGSKFQVRLVLGFIAVALVPSVFLLIVAGAFLRADVASWFNPEYERVLDDSLDIAKVYYLSAANNAAHFAREIAEEVAAKDLLRPERRARLKSLHRAAPAGLQPRHDRGFRQRPPPAADRAQPQDSDRDRRGARLAAARADARRPRDDAHRPVRKIGRDSRHRADLFVARVRRW